MIYFRFLSVFFALGIFLVAQGQALTDSVAIHFRQSKTFLDTAYMGNAKAFDHIKQIAERYSRPESDYILTGVRVIGAASPEGSVRFNDWLSEQRAERIFNYMDSNMILPDSLTRQIFLGRDWRGLRNHVAADSNVPFRVDVLSLLDDIISRCEKGEKDIDGNLLMLKKLHGGVPYLYMYRNIFPGLREANVVLMFDQLPFLLPRLDSCKLENPNGLAERPFPMPKEEKPFYMALKTNMIADALALPEIGIEFYLGKNLSIVGNWMYGWWDNDNKHKYWRAYGGDLALRWWFGSAAHKKPLTGHHVGVYGGVVTYDFEFGGKGHMGGRPGHNLWDRCMKYGGIEYGYSLPIARRFNIDFTLGLGYIAGKVVEYVPNGHCYEWLNTKMKHWVGPTKLEVSLVWLIGRGNYNKKGAAK